MRCPHCESDQTSLNWLLYQSLRYFCRGCRKTFEVNRGAVQSTARPDRVTTPPPVTEGGVPV